MVDKEPLHGFATSKSLYIYLFTEICFFFCLAPQWETSDLLNLSGQSIKKLTKRLICFHEILRVFFSLPNDAMAG